MSSNQEYPDFRTYTPPRKRRFFFYAYTLLLGVIIGVLLTNTFGPLKRGPKKEEQLSDLAESQLQPSIATQPSGALQSTFPASIQADYERMVITATQKAKPAVVSIYTSVTKYYRFRNPIWDMFYGPQSRSVSAMGSGVIIDPDGIIITNEHVIKMVKDLKESNIKVELPDGRSFDAEITHDFPGKDIAILSIKGDNLPYIEFGSSADLSPGQTVLAIGNPFGTNIGGEPSVTRGIVSSTKRSLTIPEGRETKYYKNMIQTDASINEGNSGGPLIDLNGKMVGINTAIFTKGAGSIGISFAIPSDRVKLILESVKNQSEKSTVKSGIIIQSLIRDIAEALYFKGEGGVLISKIDSGSPGEKGGFKKGDIISNIDGFNIFTIEQVHSIFRGAIPGEIYEFKVFREGKYLNLVLRLNKKQ